jgi:hypothetical protein
MGKLLVDERDIRFILFEQFKVQELFEDFKNADFTIDTFSLIIQEALKFSENILFPLHLRGNNEGVLFEKGEVFTPAGTREAYKSFVEGGWLTIGDSDEVGGQKLPHAIKSATHEIFFAANFPFMCYVNLTHDAAKLIELYGTSDQKICFMDQMYAGVFTGTMALTEPGAGSDVGAIKLKAIKRPDGTYSMIGSKIFITNGEHDVSDNIINMVLARIEGDPPGTRGLSIFIVPKYRINKDGSLGDSNDIICTGVEHKMGLHDSPTTSLLFGENGNCVGYLLGKPCDGIKIMFHMMNSSRLEVGLWGQGISSTSYLHALKYAKERLQGQSIVAPNPMVQVPIIQHPDIRRMLLMMKAYVEGMRGLLYYTGYAMDRQAIMDSDGDKQYWEGMIDLLVPICKAYPTEMAVNLASLAIQIHGGYGYSQEYPVEQFMRDSKVACIFEGTTGIQGLDFCFRKLRMNGGKPFQDIISEIDRVIKRAGKRSNLKLYAEELQRTKEALVSVYTLLSKKLSDENVIYNSLKATQFLEATGDIIIAWFLLWGALIADENLRKLFKAKNIRSKNRVSFIKENSEAAFLDGKVQSAKFFIGNILPITGGKLEAVKWGDRSAWEIAEESFG